VVLVESVSFRLVGDEGGLEGRLEVKRNGSWGTVCDDGFNDAAARVACFSLGLGYVNRKNITIPIYVGLLRHILYCSL